MATKYTKEDRLLATHIANNEEFAEACQAGDATRIMEIVHSEMEKNNLHTKGSNKLCNDILIKTKGLTKIPASLGTEIMFFVWNSRLSGTGFAVC